MPQIVIEQPGTPPMTIPLSAGEITLGRSEDNDVVLLADEVSRYHARISRNEGRTVVTDLKSLNGTYLNRQRITEHELRHLDEIWFGSKCHLIYRDDTVYGAEEDAPDSAIRERDTALETSIHQIRNEMDRIGRHITLMGEVSSKAPGAPREESAAHPPTPEELQRMRRAFHRLEALHKAHHVITANFDLKTRLTDMLGTIMEVLHAKRGFILLREGTARALRPVVSLQMDRDLTASSPSMGIAGRAAIDGTPVLMQDRRSDREFGDRESIIAQHITSAMGVPLKVKDVTLGSVYVDTDVPGRHFTEEDMELFASLASQAALAIENVRLHDRVVESEKRRLTLARFLPNALVDKIMNEPQRLALGGRKTRVTTLFCDIRGSSKIAEQMDPQSLVALLNEHFTAMTEILFAHEGTLDKYIGDEIMAVFGAPIALGDEAHRAVRAALEMQRRNEELNVLRAAEQRPQLQLGIGIDSGEVIAGYIGSPRRMDFTVVGDRVNTAKRFCDMAEPGTVVIGEETWQATRDQVHARPLGTLMLKGKERAVHAYEIIGLRAQP